MKQKVKKSVEKRVKVTSTGKLLKRHQFASGHLKSHKSKNALRSAKKKTEFAKGDGKQIRRMLGI
jgi:large subunit ribosomal protein L35